VSGPPFAPPVQERYVDARELARLMGVSERTVKRMTAAGMPSETWGMARTRRYLPSQAINWARARDRVARVNPPGRRTNAARTDRRRE
jgi:phage terminase Nu1 subunit (DNA packaging protein)